jgi:hypothetical protein
MDMKRILQALDTASSKPVEGANDMKKFLQAVSEKPSEVITEAANPHKVALPVQMAMQHYQAPEVKKVPLQTSSLLKTYLEQVNEEIEQEQAHKKQIMNQYASTIAKRVMDKKK